MNANTYIDDDGELANSRENVKPNSCKTEEQTSLVSPTLGSERVRPQNGVALCRSVTWEGLLPTSRTELAQKT